MSKGNYSIYQVKENGKTWGIRFEPLERLKMSGGLVSRSNYDLVYAGPIEEPSFFTPHEILASIYDKFNMAHPPDFAGHSLSVSDIVVLRRDQGMAAYYVDRGLGFTEVPEFLVGPYRYYATQRPVDIGTVPKTKFGKGYIVNYDERCPVEDGRFMAWGHVEYPDSLTEQQFEEYELQPAIENPDLYRYPQRQLDAQLQLVGRWENANNIPEAKRLTELQPGTDTFRLKDANKRWPANVRFKRIMAELRRPTIADQIKQYAEQAEKHNATRPAPSKGTDRDR